MKKLKRGIALLLACSMMLPGTNLNVSAQKESEVTETITSVEAEKMEARMYDREGNEITQGIPEAVVEPVKELIKQENMQKARTVIQPEIEAAKFEPIVKLVEKMNYSVIC